MDRSDDSIRFEGRGDHMICKHCHAEFPDNEANCPYCGNPSVPDLGTVDPGATQVLDAALLQQFESYPRPQEPAQEQNVAAPQMDPEPDYGATEVLDPSMMQQFAASQQYAPAQQYAPPAQYAAPQQYAPAQQYVPAQQYAPTQPYGAPQQYGAPANPSQPLTFCGRCGQPMVPGNTFCGSCGWNSAQPTAPAPKKSIPIPEAPKGKEKKKKEKKKKKGRVGLVILLAIVLLLVGGIVGGFLTNWYGFFGAGGQILLGAKNTFTAENFTADLTLSIGGTESVNTSIKASIDIENKDLTVVVFGDDKIQSAIYDGYMIQNDGDGYYATDISEQMDKILEAVDIEGKPDWQEILKKIDEELYDEVDYYIDFDEVDACILDLYRDLNNDAWLEENADYTKRKNGDIVVHSFKPDTVKLAGAALENFEAAFHDKADYEDIMDGLKELEGVSYLNDYELSFGVSKFQLRSFSFSTKIMDQDMDIEVDLEDIGSTAIDEKELSTILSDAKK